jgi:hypothetical protein
MDVTFAVEIRCRIRGFDRTAMVIVDAHVSWSSRLYRVPVRHARGGPRTCRREGMRSVREGEWCGHSELIETGMEIMRLFT